MVDNRLTAGSRIIIYLSVQKNTLNADTCIGASAANHMRRILPQCTNSVG